MYILSLYRYIYVVLDTKKSGPSSLRLGHPIYKGGLLDELFRSPRNARVPPFLFSSFSFPNV